MIPRCSIGLGIVLGLHLFVGVALAATIRVPEDVTTVLAAVDQAVAGDSVVVGPGHWMDRATRLVNFGGDLIPTTACAFPKGGVTILAPAGATATTLDVGESTTGVFVDVIMIANQVGAGNIVVEGFTLTGARNPGGAAAAVLNADKATFRSCIFTGNGPLSSPKSGGDVLEGGLAAVELIDCEVTGNTAEILMLFIDVDVRLVGCRISDNAGKCLQVEQETTFSSVYIENCEFHDCRSPGFGSAIDMVSVPNFEIRESSFVRNVATEFSGASIRLSLSSGNIEFNVFAYDSCLATNGAGAGIRWQDSSGYVRNNTFVGCHAYLNRAAFVAFGSNSLGFDNNIVAYSTGSAAVSNLGNALVSNECNLYWSNVEGDFGTWTPSPTDIFADPLFCDFAELDLTVGGNSPCVLGDCGQIGAYGEGCAGISVDAMSWGRIKDLYRPGK